MTPDRLLVLPLNFILSLRLCSNSATFMMPSSTGCVQSMVNLVCTFFFFPLDFCPALTALFTFGGATAISTGEACERAANHGSPGRADAKTEARRGGYDDCGRILRLRRAGVPARGTRTSPTHTSRLDQRRLKKDGRLYYHNTALLFSRTSLP
uniref:Putative secreted protein n=1 Tax=Ixodes ricinus TaxID=34613 RepID=A0A6B0UW26_IXORI